MKSAYETVVELLPQCTEDEKRAILALIREEIPLHEFELTVNSRAEVILEALHRAPELSLRGIRGLIGEATFVVELVPGLTGWENITPQGNHPYDAALRDADGQLTVQVKMQRRLAGAPMIKNGSAIVEVQRTRNGQQGGQATRPYRFGTFDVLAVCMEPSHQRWNSFLYIPERWLVPRRNDPTLIDILQPVSLQPDRIWTDDFNEVARRVRAGGPRPPHP